MDRFFDLLEQKYAKKRKGSSKAGGSKLLRTRHQVAWGRVEKMSLTGFLLWLYTAK